MFSRRRGRHSRSDEPRGGAPEPRRGPRHAADRTDEPTARRPDPRSAPQRPAAGPYDVAQAPPDVARLDLGSLQIPAIDGVEVRVQADPEGAVQQVVLVNESNALQLGAFAAPRSESIWDEVREEIRDSLSQQGFLSEEKDGEYGIELRARVRTPEGMADIRFVGIDGPRWMVRAVFQGPAAVEPERAGPLATCLRQLVVNRGQEAMPVREPLSLRLPKEVTEHAQAAAEQESP